MPPPSIKLKYLQLLSIIFEICTHFIIPVNISRNNITVNDHMLNKHIELFFIVDGFNNWKKASEKFYSHENSKMHINSIHFLLSINTKVPVISLLSKQKLDEQKNASTALLTIISNLRYLSQMGLCIRGHSNNDGNFLSLLDKEYWTQQKNYWLSSDIQNEILEIISLHVQREHFESIKKSEFFSIIADSILISLLQNNFL